MVKMNTGIMETINNKTIAEGKKYIYSEFYNLKSKLNKLKNPLKMKTRLKLGFIGGNEKNLICSL